MLFKGMRGPPLPLARFTVRPQGGRREPDILAPELLQFGIGFDEWGVGALLCLQVALSG